MKLLSNTFKRLISGLNSIGTLLIFGLMILVTADVSLRFLFTHPIPGVVEIVEMSIVGIVFLQLTHAMAEGKMIRADTLLGMLMVRSPRWGHALDACGQLAGMALMGVILNGQVPRFMEAWTDNSFKGNPGLFTAPTWPLELMVALGCAAAFVQFAIQLFTALRRWQRREVIHLTPQ
jgi:TRAP-type C4-dicarboxylate transport system permease small subunit